LLVFEISDFEFASGFVIRVSGFSVRRSIFQSRSFCTLATFARSVFTPAIAIDMNERKPATNSKPETHAKVIYVVDDEPMLLELATVILQPLGYTVKTFRDATSALEAFKAAKPLPVLLITDYSMHEMNGMDLIKACRQIQPDQKIVLISGTVGEDIFRNFDEKPNQFLAKPYHSKQLVDAVEDLLGK
jgi:CheY-like chemotaxis protein